MRSLPATVVATLLMAAPVAAQDAPPAAAAMAPAPTGAAPTEAAPTGAAPGDRSPADRLTYRIMVRETAIRAGLPAEIADAVAQVESAYEPRAIGAAGEVGLMQVMPPTARLLGFSGTTSDLAEPRTNIRLGVTYLEQAWRLAGRDLCTTVMKYRAGHGETRFSQRSVDYCLRVRGILAAQGYPVAGEVPKVNLVIATAPGARPRVAGRRGKGRFNWAVADARMRAVAGRITDASLMIMQ